MRRVPEVTALFWIVKVLTTALGESASDYLVHVVSPMVAVGLGAVGFAIAMVWQLSVRRYIAWVYWFVVAMVAVFGTMAADVLHIGLGVSYLDSTIFFSIALIAVFSVWYAVERTLSINSIYTARREMFYWLAVVTTFALGTSAGDMTASTMRLGYLDSGVLFTALIGAVGVAYYVTERFLTAEYRRDYLNAVAAFWLAYILTRPLGASFADWFGKAHAQTGLGWGDGTVSGLALVAFAALVAYLTASGRDVQRPRHPVILRAQAAEE